MNARRWVAGAALTLALLTGAAGTVAMQPGDTAPQAGFGQCVSGMASGPGGLAAHHRGMHGGEIQGLGQHLQQMRGMMQSDDCMMQ